MALVAAVDQPQVVGAEVRGDRVGDGVPLLRAYGEHHPVHPLHVEDRAHRVGQDRGPAQGQQHLVGGGADTGAGAGRQQHGSSADAHVGAPA